MANAWLLSSDLLWKKKEKKPISGDGCSGQRDPAIWRTPLKQIPRERFQYTFSELPCASVSKRGLTKNLSYENEWDLHQNDLVGGTHFHTNGVTYCDRGQRWEKIRTALKTNQIADFQKELTSNDSTTTFFFRSLALLLSSYNSVRVSFSSSISTCNLSIWKEISPRQLTLCRNNVCENRNSVGRIENCLTMSWNLFLRTSRGRLENNSLPAYKKITMIQLMVPV